MEDYGSYEYWSVDSNYFWDYELTDNSYWGENEICSKFQNAEKIYEELVQEELEKEISKHKDNFSFLYFSLKEILANFDKTPKEDLLKLLTCLIKTCDCGNYCLDNFKDTFFCEKPLGHPGKHKRGGLSWEEENND